MEEELRLLIKHSKVLKGLPDLDKPQELKDVSLVKILNGEEEFTSLDKLIYTINLFFKYEVDLYSQLLDLLINNYVLKLHHNHITLEKVIHPVMVDIRKRLNSEGLSNYLFTGDTTQLQPSDIFRSMILLNILVKEFQKEEFTSDIIVKGVSYISKDIEEMFEYIISHHLDVVYEDLVKATIDKDNVVLFDYLITKHRDRKLIGNIRIGNSNCTRYSAYKGSLNCLKYIYEKGGPGIWDKWTCVFAAKGGNLNCLKYAHEKGFPLDDWTCMGASQEGHLDCLKYLNDNGYPLNINTCHYAAKGGHLGCLMYAHENGGSSIWNERTCSNAAAGGHLDCLKYLHENGCPWDKETCKSAKLYGHLDCLKYTREHGLNC